MIPIKAIAVITANAMMRLSPSRKTNEYINENNENNDALRSPDASFNKPMTSAHMGAIKKNLIIPV
ncbi:MAG: hypothetical protein J6L23_05125 [Clostridia bacterium]|nr:hypothetical protein [Clostridia bacterium]